MHAQPFNVCLQAEKQIRAKNANQYEQKMLRYIFIFSVLAVQKIAHFVCACVVCMYDFVAARHKRSGDGKKTVP